MFFISKRGGRRKVSFARNVRAKFIIGFIPKICFNARNAGFGLV